MPKNGDEWRKKLICPRVSDLAETSAAAPSTCDTPVSCAATAASSAPEHSAQPSSSGKMFSYDNLRCMKQECEECKDIKLLDSLLCADERSEAASALQV